MAKKPKPKARKPKARKATHKKAARKVVRKAVKRVAAKKPPVKTVAKMPERKLIGEITHYFTHINVAVVKLSDVLKTGERILIQGATTNFEQNVNSMQIEHVSVDVARPGDSIGLKVTDRVREGDKVFRVG